MQLDKRKEFEGVLCLMTALCLFTSVPIFLRSFATGGGLDAWLINVIRYSVATMFWLPYVLWRLRRNPPDPRIWRHALAPAAANVLGQIGWAMAPYYNNAGTIGFLIRSSFLFTTVFGLALLPSERVVLRRPMFWLGSAGIIMGVVLMAWSAFQTGSSSLRGVSILLLTAMFWGMYSVLIRRNMESHDARVSFGVISLYTTAVLWGALFLFGDISLAQHIEPALWGKLVLSAMLGITFSHILLYKAIHALGPVVTQGSTCAQPFLISLAAWLILHESMTSLQWCGGIVLIASCFAMILLKTRGPRTP